MVSYKVYNLLFIVMYAIRKHDVHVKSASSTKLQAATKGVAILPSFIPNQLVTLVISVKSMA